MCLAASYIEFLLDPLVIQHGQQPTPPRLANRLKKPVEHQPPAGGNDHRRKILARNAVVVVPLTMP